MSPEGSQERWECVGSFNDTLRPLTRFVGTGVPGYAQVAAVDHQPSDSVSSGLKNGEHYSLTVLYFMQNGYAYGQAHKEVRYAR